MFGFKRPVGPAMPPVSEISDRVGRGEMVLLDVREPAELRSTGTAVGAINIPLAMLAMRADPRSPDHDARLRPEVPVVLFCASGGRSGMGAQLMQKLGYAEVHNLGGFGDWVRSGGPVLR